MATTPEGKVKNKVSKMLKEAEATYYFMPVQTGFGMSTLDYLGASAGRAFAIETKAPGKKLTTRQKCIAIDMERAGMRVFVISGNPLEYEELRLFLFGAGAILRKKALEAGKSCKE